MALESTQWSFKACAVFVEKVQEQITQQPDKEEDHQWGCQLQFGKFLPIHGVKPEMVGLGRGPAMGYAIESTIQSGHSFSKAVNFCFGYQVWFLEISVPHLAIDNPIHCGVDKWIERVSLISWLAHDSGGTGKWMWHLPCLKEKK